MSDDDPAVRKVAIFALGQTRDTSAIPALRPRLEDAVEDIRWNAALALAVLGDPSGREVIAQMLDRSHLDRIEGITEDQKTAAIVNALQAVYLLRDATSIDKVRELSRSDPSLRVRDVALKTLEAIERGR
jgi:HEAT repeat protein